MYGTIIPITCNHKVRWSKSPQFISIPGDKKLLSILFPLQDERILKLLFSEEL
ncbi:hypothetical protein X975_03793, partial [Stegodyphus mimosarum]